MKKILFIIICTLITIILGSITYATYTYSCFQEFANVSNGCGDSSSGVYEFNSIFWYYPIGRLVDGDYSTFNEYNGTNGTTARLNITYNVPYGAVNYTMMFKTGNWAGQANFNFSIDQDCIVSNKIKLRYDVNSSITPYCVNYLTGAVVHKYQEIGVTPFYEEAVNWSIQPIFGFCNSSLNYTLLNFSIKDEINLSNVLGSISSTYYYRYVNDTGSWSYTSYVNTSLQNFSMCSNGNNVFILNYSILYSATNYPQRRYDIVNQQVGDTITNKILYLLNSAYGNYIRYVVMDNYGNPITGATVTVYWNSNILEQRSTDGTGLVTFFLSSLNDYVIYFVKSGYQTQILNINNPSFTDPVQVTLGSVAGNASVPVEAGIGYTFSPDFGNLVNGTNYTFGFNLTSQYYSISSCLLNISNSSGNLLAATSGVLDAHNCTLSFNVNTSTYSQMILNAYVITNITTLHYTKTYTVQNWYSGDVSLKRFIDRVSLFNGAGFNNFGKWIIAIFIIIIILGFTSIQIKSVDSGARNIGIGIMIIILCWFFSYINWFAITTITFHQPFTEFLNQWIIFIFVCILTIAFILYES